MQLANPQSHSGIKESKSQWQIAFNQYGCYCVPLSSQHRHVSRKILAGGIWESRTIDFIIAHCAAGGDIVHAGTYFGDFLPAFSKSCSAGGKVWAFEPNPENFECAATTIMINGLKNVQIINAALGEFECSLPLIIKDRKGNPLGGVSVLKTKATKEHANQFIEVRVVRLDDIFPLGRKLSIIQLDVERYEQAVLAGAMNTIKRNRPILILETIPEANWLSKNIRTLGYREVMKLHSNTVFTT